MNTLFWVLLILGLLLILSPLVGLIEATAATLFYVLGALLLVAAIIWAISALSRTTTATMPPTP